MKIIDFSKPMNGEAVSFNKTTGRYFVRWASGKKGYVSKNKVRVVPHKTSFYLRIADDAK